MYRRLAVAGACVLSASVLIVALAACSSSGGSSPSASASSSVSSSAGGGASGTSASGSAAADQARQRVAAAFWQLEGSLREGIRSTDGLGAFTTCGSSAADSLIYTVQAGVQPARGAKPTQSAFATSILGNFAATGWKLPRSGAGTYTADRGGLSVRLQVSADSGASSGSFYVRSGCVSVGSSAQQIASDYSSGQSDDYPLSEASSKPVPTTFPTPGA